MGQIEIRQRKSAIGEKDAAHGTLRALGLRRPGDSVHQEDTPQLRGMLRRIAHLVEVKGEGKST